MKTLKKGFKWEFNNHWTINYNTFSFTLFAFAVEPKKYYCLTLFNFNVSYYLTLIEV